jgi:hypothetical protein
MDYSTGVKSYHPDAGICTCGGHCVVVWCLDNPCGWNITGSFLIVFNISNIDKEKIKNSLKMIS